MRVFGLWKEFRVLRENGENVLTPHRPGDKPATFCEETEFITGNKKKKLT